MSILTSQTGFVCPDLEAFDLHEFWQDRLSNLSSEMELDGGSWQQQMKWAIRDENQLKSLLGLDDTSQRIGESTVIRALNDFPVFVPLPFLARIQPIEPDDPLLRQVLPLPDEDVIDAGYSTDPLEEQSATRTPGLLHKYHGRVLMVTTGACAVNCRYCFRRHFPYDESPRSPEEWSPAIEQIAADSSVEEVILSGGDPLTLVDERIESLLNQLSKIDHLKRLRIHTRLPIMIPQRVTDRLLKVLTNSRMQTVIVLHSNHARELDDAVQAAIGKLAGAGSMLLNQSVLLRGINDSVEALVELSERLLECRVLPYYLHKNDPIAGTAHFEVSIERGIELVKQMRAGLPGYAVPRFVQEVAGEPGKSVLA